jgi:c-di-GMP-binding flagellar brake protein YcgR
LRKKLNSSGEDKRSQKRAYIEPYDTGTFLEFRLDERQYRFNLLDTSPGGIGMLVPNMEVKVLKELKTGDQIEMEYGTYDARALIRFEIRHITPIKRGTFKGHYQVGLSLSCEPN